MLAPIDHPSHTANSEGSSTSGNGHRNSVGSFVNPERILFFMFQAAEIQKLV